MQESQSSSEDETLKGINEFSDKDQIYILQQRIRALKEVVEPKSPSPRINLNKNYYSNKAQIPNPFKAHEDPLGFCKKRVLTKQDISFITRLERKAKALNVLDQNGKIDRQVCLTKLEQLDYKQETEAMQDILQKLKQTKQPLSALDTDQVYKTARQQFDALLPKIKKIISKSPLKYDRNCQDHALLLELERRLDVKDLKEILECTKVETRRATRVKELVKLCKKFKLNINLPGNDCYDPKLPDLSCGVQNYFVEQFTEKCSDPLAFHKYKQHQVDMLELNAHHKMTVENKRTLERQKVKFMAIIYNGKGIQSLSKTELKMCFDLEIISKQMYETERQRRRAIYLLKRYQHQIKSHQKRLSEMSSSFSSQSSIRKSGATSPVLLSPRRQKTHKIREIQDETFQTAFRDVLLLKEQGRKRAASTKELLSSQNMHRRVDQFGIFAEPKIKRNFAISLTRIDEQKETQEVRQEIKLEPILPQITAVKSLVKKKQIRMSDQDVIVHTDYKKIAPQTSEMPRVVSPVCRSSKQATPFLRSPQIQDLVKRYPVTVKLDVKSSMDQHQRKIRKDLKGLRQVEKMSQIEMADNKKILADFTINKLLCEIQQVEDARNSRILKELDNTSASSIQLIFNYKRTDELDQILDADEVAKEYLNLLDVRRIRKQVGRKL